MIGDAISYPTQRDDWLTTILLGGGLYILAMVPLLGIIGMGILSGYYVRVLRSVATDEEIPPLFDEWAELFVNGIKYIAISFVYSVIPFLLSFLILLILGLDLLLSMLIAYLPGLVAVYLLPVALTNFALTDSVDAAFDISTITDAAFTTEYFIAFVVAIIIGFVLVLIATPFTVVLVGFGVLFYAGIVVHYLIARGCGSMLRQDPEEAFDTRTR